MIGKLLLTVCIFILFHSGSEAQFISLSDTTIIFKNQEGKVLSREEVQELMKGTFSIRQEVVNGKKTITIIPTEKDEWPQPDSKIEMFKHSLINKPVKAFKLIDLNNKSWDSNELKGKVTVINFWFTTCKPCILEMPHLNKLVEANKEKEVIFIAPAPETEGQIKKFLKKYRFDYNVIPSSLNYITTLGVESFPTHIVIDKEGVVRQVFVGYADDIPEKLQEEIDKLL